MSDENLKSSGKIDGESGTAKYWDESKKMESAQS